MQRPIMNPSFRDESPPGNSRRRLLRLACLATWRCVRLGFRFLTYDPLSHIKSFRAEEGSASARAIRGLLYRLAFVPVLVAGAACAIVWVSTHPRSVTAEIDPASLGIYYDAVTLLGTDQTRLEGWLVPQIDAKTVIEDGEKALRRKHPAVVLVHDLGRRREQMLPLIRPLHDAGMVVQAINLRGGGPSAGVGETFGLNESLDVQAAVEMLRRRPFVDPKRIAVVGCGTGATAALLAARADGRIAAVVADRPMCDAKELLDTRLTPSSAVAWLTPLCKWTFEISYGVDMDDVALSNFKKLFDSRPVLMIDTAGAYADPSDPWTIGQIRSFLTEVLPSDSMLAGVKP